MQSSLISKIEKAKRYAQEPERVALYHLGASFRGDHDCYTLSYGEGKWQCSCRFFSTWQTCSHVMAMQRMLGQMLPEGAVPAGR